MGWKIKRRNRFKDKTASPARLAVDFVRLKIGEAWGRRASELTEIMKGYEIPLLNQYIHELKKNGKHTDQDEVQVALEKLFLAINYELEELISKHSIQWWYLVETRLPYFTTYTASKATLSLYRLTLRLAILKYGLASPLDTHIVESQIVPVDVSDQDVIDLYKVERLSYTAYMLTADLRNLWKGGTLRFIAGVVDYGWDHAQATAAAIDWMDLRGEEGASSLFYSSGIFMASNLEDILNKKSLDHPPFPTFVIPNFDHEIKWARLPAATIFPIANDFAPNCILLPLDFEAVETSILFLSPFFEQKYGFTSRQLVQVLVLFAYRAHMMFKPHPERVLQVSNRGYITALSWEDIVKDIVAFWSDLSAHSVRFREVADENREETARSVLERFLFKAFDETNRKTIELVSRGPVPWLIELVDGKVIVDYRNYIHALNDFIHESLLSASEMVGNKVRNAFPELCWNQVKAEFSDAELVWPVNRELKGAEGKKRECDLAFQIEDLLVVCECKARRSNAKKLIGERGAMLNVWKDSLDDLKTVVSLTQFIAENRNAPSLSVPTSVRFIAPLVVYPNVPWISEKREPYCISGSIPRFITPQELRKLTRHQLLSLTNDPLTICSA